MKTGKKVLSGILTLALLLSLVSGVPVWAAEGDAEPPTASMWGPTDITVSGVEGQEYVIAPAGSEPDWSQAVEPTDGFVTYDGLNPTINRPSAL